MTAVELNERIAKANAMCDKLNNERQMNLGKKETLTTQLNAALKEYTELYGVPLTVETLNMELQRVQSEKEAEVEKVEKIIQLIGDGNYIEARRLAGEEIVEENNDLNLESVDNITENEVKKEKKKRGSKNQVEETVNQSVVSTEPTVGVMPTPPTIPVTPTPSAPTVPSTPVAPSVPVAPTPSAPVAPSVPVTPTPSAPVAPSVPVAPTPSAPITPLSMGNIETPPVLGGVLDGFQPADAALGNLNVAPPTTFQSILGETPFKG